MNLKSSEKNGKMKFHHPQGFDAEWNQYLRNLEEAFSVACSEQAQVNAQKLQQPQPAGSCNSSSYSEVMKTFEPISPPCTPVNSDFDGNNQQQNLTSPDIVEFPLIRSPHSGQSWMMPPTNQPVVTDDSSIEDLLRSIWDPDYPYDQNNNIRNG